MRKNSFLVLILVAVLILSGCSLVVKDQEVDDARVIVDVNGETVNKKTILSAFEYNLSMEKYYQQYYSSYLGYNTEVNEDEILQSTLDGYVENLVKKQKITTLGFDQFTEDDLATINETANKDFTDALENVKTNYFADSKLESDALETAVKEYASNIGYTFDNALENAKSKWTLEKLEKSVTDSVSISNEDIQVRLDSKIEEEKASYESSLSAYGYAVNNGTVVYYTPAGYRYVKQILVKFTEEDSAAIKDAGTVLTEAETSSSDLQKSLTETTTALSASDISEDEKAALNSQINDLNAQLVEAEKKVKELTQAKSDKEAAAYTIIEPKANEVYNKLLAGENFDDLIAVYNEDTGMPATGYAICSGYTYFDPEFTNAAMNLKNVGAISEKTEGIYGYYIIQYSADIAEGAATLESARDSLYDETLKAKKDETYTAAVTAWVEEADVAVYKERIAD